MTIKKSYAELVSFLEENKNKKVSTILDEVYKMTQQKVNSKTFLTDKDGQVFAIYCYYHKQWELLDQVTYGKKASSTTGFNTMCKQGVSLWTKQNNSVKKVSDKVITMLENEEILPTEINETKERLILEAKEIDTTDMPIGYQSIEEAEEAYHNL